MSTKYSVSGRTRWTFDGNPRLTDHAAERWDERVPSDSVAPETAYERGVDVSRIADILEDRGNQIPDSVRYFYEITETEAYGVLFVVKDDVIKTIYRPYMLDDEPTKAYLAAHNPEFQQ